jgi:hypothetical protein
MRWLAAVGLGASALACVAILAAEPAEADVGVERVSRGAGAPGEEIVLTLGCGFCFPPCKGPPGHRTPSPCMLDTKAPPPESFPISLVPIAKASQLHRCGPNALCPPRATGPPHHDPFTFLGKATPPAQSSSGNVGAGANIPRYRLAFEVPDVPPGLYAYVIYCETCLKGKGGALILYPGGAPWRLRVLPARPSRLEAFVR